MKHKLLKINIVIFLGLAIGSLQGQTTMNVMSTSGTLTAYTFSGIRKLTFPSTGNMTITKTTVATDNYVLTAVRYMNFSDVGTYIEHNVSLQGILKLYPNPVLDVLHIKHTATEKQYATVELLSIEGKLLYKSKLSGDTYTINLSQFKQGIYLCRINDGTRIQTTKIFKK